MVFRSMRFLYFSRQIVMLLDKPHSQPVAVLVGQVQGVGLRTLPEEQPQVLCQLTCPSLSIGRAHCQLEGHRECFNVLFRSLKQNRIVSGAAFCGVTSRAILFVYE